MAKAIMKENGKIDKVKNCSQCSCLYYNELKCKYFCGNLNKQRIYKRIPKSCDLIDYDLAVKIMEKFKEVNNA